MQIDRYKRLSILMPVYNEARTLRRIVRAVLDCPSPIPLELVIVDDASTDHTPEILRQLESDPAFAGIPLPAGCSIRTITHPVNRGKGAAIRNVHW